MFNNNIGLVVDVVENEELSTPSSHLPSPATDLTAAYVSSRFLTLSWQFANKEEGSIEPLGYLIYWNEKDSARYTLIIIINITLLLLYYYCNIMKICWAGAACHTEI